MGRVTEARHAERDATGRGRGLSKLVISRVIIRVAPFRVVITLLITYLLSIHCPSK